jgi:putative two-component system response regulator
MPKRLSYRVLIVDDEADVRRAHAQLVAALGYEAELASDGIEALTKLALDIDLVLLDGGLPNFDGYEVARRIRESPEHAHLPVIMVSGLTRPEDRLRAIEVGVNDFILKPVDAHELGLKAKWMLELKSAYDRLRKHEAELSRSVDEKTHALRAALVDVTEAHRATQQAYLDTISRLMTAAEYRDKDTAGHIERIGLYSGVVATVMAFSPSDIDMIRHAAPMHDVGKLGVPDRVLLKPDKLTDDEWVVMRAHTTMGAQILSGSAAPVIQLGGKIAISHHERWDGSGYPNGLAGEGIPIEGRICAVVDVFDAMTMDRPYRKAVSNDEAVAMLEKMAGSHLDSRVLDAFLRSLDEIIEIQASNRAAPTT